MAVLYNEIDPYCAAWLRNLVSRGLVATGDVAECSIEDLRPSDLRGYSQVHFFAGIGVWSYALRRAGIPDTANVWTGSCPCQPFSAAGKGGGFADERHLWPAFHHLIAECRPAIVLGEQVASKDGLAWLDLVQSDLEGTSYAAAAVDICAAGFGAPHIRQRLYWMATSALDHAADARRQVAGQYDGGSSLFASRPLEPSAIGELADTTDGRRRELGCPLESRHVRHADSGCDASCRLADSDGGDASAERQQRSWQQRQQPEDGVLSRSQHPGIGHNAGPAMDGPGPTNGLWRDADWLLCRDGKWRPVEPGTFPLAHGAPARVGRLRAYGNAINAEQATAFCEVVRELSF